MKKQSTAITMFLILILTVQIASVLFSSVVRAEELYGNVNLAFPADVEAGLNPYRAGLVSDRIIRGLMRSFLIEMDERLNKHPELCSVLWTPSPDYMNWTIRIVENATWHDGKPVTAEDVAFSYNTILNASMEFVGMWMSAGRYINSTEVLDDYTILLKMKEPMWIIDTYAGAQFRIVPKHIWEKVDDPVQFPDWDAIGSGPFMLKERIAGRQVVLEAYEDYYRGSPNIKTVTFKIIKEPSVALLALQRGKVDAVPFHDIPPIIIYDIQNNPGKYPNIEVVLGKSFSSMTTLAFNLRLYPYNIADFRKAVAYALDYDRMIDDVFYGFVDRVNPQLSHPFFQWYDDSIPMIERDLTRARELLEGAGFIDVDGDGWREAPNGEEFTMNILSENSLLAMDLNDLVVLALEDIGIRAQAEPKDAHSVHDIMRTYRLDYDAALCTSSDSYLLNLMYPTGYYFKFNSDREPSPGKNIAGFRNETYDLLSSEILYETNYTKVVEMTRECGQILAQELPQIGIAYGYHAQVYREDRIAGWVVIEESAHVTTGGTGVGINHLANWLSIYELAPSYPGSGADNTLVIIVVVAAVVIVAAAFYVFRLRKRRK
jgi:peptide/nickel transport system substrate-binding protein